MKKRKHALPEEASEVERVLALHKRLYPHHFPKLYRKVGNPGPEASRALELLWAAIGRKLAEKEREFSRGSGRRSGSKYKKAPLDTEENRRLRNYRDNKARKKRIIHIAGEDFELEPGVSLEPVWKR